MSARIKLLRPFRISLDGIHSAQYAAGDVLDAPDATAASLIKDRLAEAVVDAPAPVADPAEAPAVADVVETKVDGPAETKPAGKAKRGRA